MTPSGGRPADPTYREDLVDRAEPTDRADGADGADRADPPHGIRERGSASVLVIALVAAVLSLTVGALVLASAVRSSHTARAAGDLAALAAAMVLRDGGAPGSACARAASIAGANSARLHLCSVAGTDVTVIVTVPVAVSVAFFTWSGSATARAKAGQERPAP